MKIRLTAALAFVALPFIAQAQEKSGATEIWKHGPMGNTQDT